LPVNVGKHEKSKIKKVKSEKEDIVFTLSDDSFASVIVLITKILSGLEFVLRWASALGDRSIAGRKFVVEGPAMLQDRLHCC
jgi:hypothetical protein